MSVRVPELLMPAGNLSKLKTAFTYGADAVYAGAAGFSMRPDGASFAPDDLRAGVAFAHQRGKKVYIGVNTMVSQGELEPLQRWLEETADIDFDAIIVGDPATLCLVRQVRPALEIHISTQMGVANALAARFWRDAGASRVILARECTIDGAASVAAESGVAIEYFVHGAMCVAVSGRCLLSAHLSGHSASKGHCKHSCRWEWQLVEQKRPGETMPVFETGKETIFLGSTDLCLIDHIPALVTAGLCSLKVEGRMKSEYYVAGVARVYRAALDAFADDPKNFSTDPAWAAELEAVSHRPYATGFAFGYPSDRPEALQTHNNPVRSHQLCAVVEGARDGRSVLNIKHPVCTGDRLEWIGPGMTGGQLVIDALWDEEGAAIDRATSARMVTATVQGGVELPAHSFLRKRV